MIRLGGNAVTYTIRFDTKIWQIARKDIRTGLRGASVRVEQRLDGSLAVRFGNRYVGVTECLPRPKVAAAPQRQKRKPAAPRGPSQWMKNFHLTSPEKTSLSALDAFPSAREKKAIR